LAEIAEYRQAEQAERQRLGEQRRKELTDQQRLAEMTEQRRLAEKLDREEKQRATATEQERRRMEKQRQQQDRAREEPRQREETQWKREHAETDFHDPHHEPLRSEEELRRIQMENDRLTEMFKAKERNNQVSSNLPQRYHDAWETYESKWAQLRAQVKTGNLILTFSTVPWPTLSPPVAPESITQKVVGAFILSQWHSKEKSRKDRIREALRLWHPDRFGRFLDKVPEGNERDNVHSGVGNVIRSLNELLTKESSSGAL
jgi:hypothetical protein